MPTKPLSPSILKDYQTALNGSDTEAALKLYAPDGVFMPQHSPASVGTAALAPSV